MMATGTYILVVRLENQPMDFVYEVSTEELDGIYEHEYPTIAMEMAQDLIVSAEIVRRTDDVD